MLVFCASTILNSQLSTPNSLQAQNYSTSDTVTEYPLKGTFYHDKFEGRKTASGEIFDQNAFTAAHWCIKMGTYIIVTNQNTGLQVIVKVNDRCPKRGVIDLSHRAATAIGIRGCQPVTVRLLPDGYQERCLAQDAQFDSVHSRLHHKPADSTKTPAQIHTQAPPQSSETGERYNLILCNVASHGEAYNSIQKLPPAYREKALVESVGDSTDLQVSLDVQLSRRHAEELLRELVKKFPKASIAPIP